MGNRNKYIISDRMGKAQEEICNELYQKSSSKVYDYANKVKMPYSNCAGCETSTPTIVTQKEDTCALCGISKEIQEKYN